jgi:hypothetical protein
MNDVLQGQSILNQTIALSLKHPDYARVTDLAEEYFDIFTGSGIAPYLKKLRKSETDEGFRQTLDIFQTSIPATVNNLNTMFEKPLRSNRIFSTIEHESSTARDEILDRMSRFWQGVSENGVDAYLRERWKYLLTYDPNAFIALEFNDFNPIKEKATPFAIEYSSREAINYAWNQGVLDWLIVQLPITYMIKTGDKLEPRDGSQYIMYLENDAIVYTEVDPKSRYTTIPDPQYIEIRKDPKAETPDHVFVYQLFNTKATRVPAVRVGYMLDPESKSIPQTCLSMLHHSLAFFKKELISEVELDLTIRAHVFPQKYMMGPKCSGDKEAGKTCKNGVTANGDTCAICNGTGVLPVHTTSTDLIVLPIPRNNEDPILDPTKAMAYFAPPIELVKFMVDYVDRLTEKAKTAIFASQVVSTSTNTATAPTAGGTSNQATTATQQDYSWDNVYDTYRPFTGRYSYSWLFIVTMIATYTDNMDGLKLFHSFPNDYKLKPVSTLMTEAASAKNADLPQHVLEAIHNDIANVYYADDPDTLTKIQIKNRFHPFSGKAVSEVQALLMGSDLLPYYRYLYIYFDIIFDEIDQELGDQFYLWTYEKQKAELQNRVQALRTQIDAQKLKDFKTAQNNLPPNNPQNQN